MQSSPSLPPPRSTSISCAVRPCASGASRSSSSRPRACFATPTPRHPSPSSASPRFLNVLPDNDVTNPRRLLVCSGKIGHNLRVERAKRKDHVRRHHLRRAALSLARSRAARRARPASQRPGDCLGPGRARQHGRLHLRHAASCAASPATAPCSASSAAPPHPRHRLRQGSRDRRKNPHRSRVWFSPLATYPTDSFGRLRRTRRRDRVGNLLGVNLVRRLRRIVMLVQRPDPRANRLVGSRDPFS